ncbi:Hypothetical predicted protein [Cloeon dipterum]|uniref:Uncharacterized protein n=1 Tax=Cloeon dipterum TaxID=197152 RepID=A0A8S1C384_9INSE|nr:Hypothetical predicted protein [Cloeon dipterum]
MESLKVTSLFIFLLCSVNSTPAVDEISPATDSSDSNKNIPEDAFTTEINQPDEESEKNSLALGVLRVADTQTSREYVRAIIPKIRVAISQLEGRKAIPQEITNLVLFTAETKGILSRVKEATITNRATLREKVYILRAREGIIREASSMEEANTTKAGILRVSKGSQVASTIKGRESTIFRVVMGRATTIRVLIQRVVGIKNLVVCMEEGKTTKAYIHRVKEGTIRVATIPEEANTTKDSIQEEVKNLEGGNTIKAHTPKEEAIRDIQEEINNLEGCMGEGKITRVFILRVKVDTTKDIRVVRTTRFKEGIIRVIIQEEIKNLEGCMGEGKITRVFILRVKVDTTKDIRVVSTTRFKEGIIRVAMDREVANTTRVATLRAGIIRYIQVINTTTKDTPNTVRRDTITEVTTKVRDHLEAMAMETILLFNLAMITTWTLESRTLTRKIFRKLHLLRLQRVQLWFPLLKLL